MNLRWDRWESPGIDAAMTLWHDKAPSTIQHHGADCCEHARHWFYAMDASARAMSPSGSGPVWIRQRYEWGPSRWPLHWCEIVEASSLDCGAHAALAFEALNRRGDTCLPVQLIQSFSNSDCGHWGESWASENLPADWILDGLVYHEGCAQFIGSDRVRVWDATDSLWIEPQQRQGYGSTLAIRICAAGAEPVPVALQSIEWDGVPIGVGQWISLLPD